MHWPTPDEFNEAVQNPQFAFADPELATGRAVVGPLGIPLPYSGAFADVYQFECGKRTVAVKCFTRPVEGLEMRYAAIAYRLKKVRLGFTVGFEYLPRGIRHHDAWYPAVKMDWVAGVRLNEFIAGIVEKPKLLSGLIRILAKIGDELDRAEVGHGDLQHGNVLLIPAKAGTRVALRLVDYDGMWVPDLANDPPGEVGHPDYQHPGRAKEGYYGPFADRFSLLVVAAGIRCLIVGGTDLWRKYDSGTNVLFRENDFLDPHRSDLFAELLRTTDPVAIRLVAAVAEGAIGPIRNVPRLSDVLANRHSIVVPTRAIQRPSTDERSPWWGLDDDPFLTPGDQNQLSSSQRETKPNVSSEATRRVVTARREGSIRTIRLHRRAKELGWQKLKWVVSGAVALFALVAIVWAIHGIVISRGPSPIISAERLPKDTPHEQPVTRLEEHIPPSTSISIPAPQTTAPNPLPLRFSVEQARDAQTAWAKSMGQSVNESIEFGAGVRMSVTLIPPGSFDMGSPADEKGRHADERLHGVTILRPFYLGTFEVTQKQYFQLMGSNPSDFQATGRFRARVDGLSTDLFPVDGISWNDANGFCERLGRITPEWVSKVRLPTEAEWEYSCRAGTSTPFSFGTTSNGLQANGNGHVPYGTATKGPFLNRTCEVGQYRSNAFGLYDMHGNVWEWCADYFGEYSSLAPLTDPFNVTPFHGKDCTCRVLRGGAWDSHAGGRSAERSYRGAMVSSEGQGFRIVLVPTTPAAEK